MTGRELCYLIMTGKLVNRLYLIFASILFLASCSESIDVDPAAVLPGSWECDDGIVVTFSPDGKYEWRVPPDDQLALHVEDSDQIRMNDDGGHSIFDNWRVDANALELDMFGEADRYNLSFESKSKFRMDGPDDFTCRRQ